MNNNVFPLFLNASKNTSELLEYETANLLLQFDPHVRNGTLTVATHEGTFSRLDTDSINFLFSHKPNDAQVYGFAVSNINGHLECMCASGEYLLQTLLVYVATIDPSFQPAETEQEGIENWVNTSTAVHTALDWLAPHGDVKLPTHFFQHSPKAPHPAA